MKSARLGSNDPAAVTVAFLDPKFDDLHAREDSYWMECRVQVRAGAEAAGTKVTMIQPYRDDTIAFFQELSASGDDWRGSASWYSENGELELDAEAVGDGSMRVRVAIREYAHLEPIQVAELVVSLADLRTFTQALTDLFRVPWIAPQRASALGRWTLKAG